MEHEEDEELIKKKNDPCPDCMVEVNVSRASPFADPIRFLDDLTSPGTQPG